MGVLAVDRQHGFAWHEALSKLVPEVGSDSRTAKRSVARKGSTTANLPILLPRPCTVYDLSCSLPSAGPAPFP